jgi:hypothetical protein
MGHPLFRIDGFLLLRMKELRRIQRWARPLWVFAWMQRRERKMPGTRRTDLSSLFNDNTAASPVSDGDRVVFMNVGSGWVHVSQAPPIVVGYLIYFSTMVGMVYILKRNVEGNG